MSAHCDAARAARPARLLLLALALGTSACGGHDAGRHDAQHALTPAGQVTPAPKPRRPGAPLVAWTYETVLRRIDGKVIHVGSKDVRIDAGTVVCGGVGAAAKRVGGSPAWTRFRCVQPTFPPGAVAGPDAIFFVEPAGSQRFAVTGARFSHY